MRSANAFSVSSNGVLMSNARYERKSGCMLRLTSTRSRKGKVNFFRTAHNGTKLTVQKTNIFMSDLTLIHDKFALL